MQAGTLGISVGLFFAFLWFTCSKLCDANARYDEREAVEEMMRKYGLKLNELTVRNRKKDIKGSLASPSGPNRFVQSLGEGVYTVLEDTWDDFDPKPIPAKVRATFEKYDRNKTGNLSVNELKAALREHGLDANNHKAAAKIAEYDEMNDGQLDLPEFAQLIEDLHKKPKPKPKPKPAPPPAEDVPVDIAKLGPRARADLRAEEKWQKKADAEAAKAKEKEEAIRAAESVPTHPLAEAIRERAGSELAWSDCLEQVVEWDAVEDKEERRPQLKGSKALARAAVEKALRRFGVTMTQIETIAYGATSGELVAFFYDHVDTKYRDMIVASLPAVVPQLKTRSPRRSTSPKRSNKEIKLVAGSSGEMRASVSKIFLDGLGKPTHGVDKLWIVVEWYDPAQKIGDIIIFERESDAFEQVLVISGNPGLAPGTPLEYVAGVALEDIKVLCDEWQAPSRWVQPGGSPQGVRSPPRSP